MGFGIWPKSVIEATDRVRDLGVIVDSSLSTRHHIAEVTFTCFFHFGDFARLARY